MMMCWTHKQLEELEDPLVSEDVKCVSCDWINDRQAVNFVFDERVHSIKQAATQHTQLKEAPKKNQKQLLACTEKTIEKCRDERL